MPRFKLGEKTYDVIGIDEISLRGVIEFDAQAAALGLSERFSDIEQVASLPENEVQQSPLFWLITGYSIWASRRAAGDDVTLAEVFDAPVSDITWLPETRDHKPGKAKGAKTPKKQQVSGVAAEPVADETGTPTTSVEKSTAE